MLTKGVGVLKPNIIEVKHALIWEPSLITYFVKFVLFHQKEVLPSHKLQDYAYVCGVVESFQIKRR